MVRAGIALILASLVCVPPVQAATYYVRTGGGDDNNGRSPAKAFASISRAASLAGGEDTVIVGPGRYREGSITPLGSGLRGEPVRFLADRDGRRTGDAPGEVLLDATGFAVGFRFSSRPWVVLDGFSVTGAAEEGISVKSGSDHVIVANCTVFSNAGRGIWIRDSEQVMLFNNLVYANASTGIDFGGDRGGSSGGLAVGNTIYGNGLDGLRVEGVVPSENLTVVHNLIAQNLGRGINLKERSADGFVAQWNLNLDGYGSAARAAAFDFNDSPLLVAPTGADRVLGGSGHADDDFRLRQTASGQREQSPAVDAALVSASWLGLEEASTRTDGRHDGGSADVGFHYGSTRDIAYGSKRFDRRTRQLRERAKRCERLGARLLERGVACGVQRHRLRAVCGPRAGLNC